jgi:hypothetical protein
MRIPFQKNQVNVSESLMARYRQSLDAADSKAPPLFRAELNRLFMLTQNYQLQTQYCQDQGHNQTH